MEMTTLIRRELPDIADLVMVEALHQSRERGTYVSPRDPQVQSRVAEQILAGFGEALRRRHVTDVAPDDGHHTPNTEGGSHAR